MCRDYQRDKLMVDLLASLSASQRLEFIGSLKKKQKKEILGILERVKKS